MNIKQRLSLCFIGIVLMVANQNCAKKDFGQFAADEPTQVPSEELVQVDINSSIELPKISSVIPDCLPNTKCKITFKLNKASTLPLSFLWKTDDSEVSTWKTGTLPPNVVWGIVNMHYISASDEVLFQPGQTEKVIEIQNINQSASGIRLKILISQCLLGTGSYRCQLFF